MVEWWRFAETLQSQFSLTAELSAAVQPLVVGPPAREVLYAEGSRFEGETPPAPEDITLKWLLKMTYRVRNNLFHGGKWPSEPARDVPLLEAAMAVLRECVALDDELREVYGAA